MLPPEILLAFVASLGGQPLETAQRGMPFTAVVRDQRLVVTPASTGRARPVSPGELRRVLELFARTGSLLPSDYQRLSVNASYVLTLIQRWQ